MRIRDLKEKLQSYHVDIKEIEPGLFESSFSVKGVTKIFVRFRGSPSDKLEDGLGGDYVMSFTGVDARGKETATLLNHGRPFSVFSGVYSSILSFIDLKNPDMIEFSIDQSEIKRGATYDALLDNATFPNGYVWDRDGNYNYFIFVDGYR